jgi:hypothetical protein
MEYGKDDQQYRAGASVVGPETFTQERLERAKRGLSLDDPHEATRILRPYHAEPSPRRRPKHRRRFVVETAHEALRIWAAELKAVDSYSPQGLDRPGESGGESLEHQVYEMVVATDGYWSVRNTLANAYNVDLPIPLYALIAVTQFMRDLEAQLPFRPDRRPETLCRKEEVDAITEQVNDAAERKYPLRWRQK